MISQCPKCHKRLTDFAVACDKCGWSIVDLAASTVNGGPQNGRPKNASAADNGPAESVPLEAGEEPPIIIVKKVAKTIAPPPEDRQSDDLLPPEITGEPGDSVPTQEIDLQIQRALEYIEQANYNSALSCLNRAIIDVPPERLAECFSLRGYVHLKNLEFERAEHDCTQAIDQHWVDAQTYAWRAAARGEQNKWRKAFDDLERACELAGDQRDQYLGLMDSYSQTASAFYREQVQSGNESADLFFERGWIYIRCGKFEKAERDFNFALEREPTHPWASVGLAKLRFENGSFGEVRDLCSTGAHGDEACETAALEIRVRVNHHEGNISSARRDLDRLHVLADGDPKRTVECCRLRNEIGDHVKAINDLSETIVSNPDLHYALLVRGDCYRSIKNYALAVADYCRFLEFYPDDFDAIIGRAEMYLASNRIHEAHADLDDALEIETASFDAYLIRSQLLLKEEKLDLALEQCQKAVRLDNQKPDGFGVLAQIYQSLADYGNAIQEYSRSAELAKSPEDQADYLYRRGTCFYEMEKLDKAMTDFEQSSSMRPNHAGSWIWLAATAAREEKWSQAIKGLQKAIAIRPAAAQQYQALGRPVAEKAIEFFDRQQQSGQSDANLFRQRGLAYQFLGKHDEAIKDYTLAFKAEPDQQEILIRRGQVYASANDHFAAARDFSSVIEVEPRNDSARYCRALSLLAQGRIADAQSDLSVAIEIAPKHACYHVLLAELNQKSGNLPGVLAAYDKAILLDPTDALTYRRRGAVHLSAQNYLNAISDFTHSLELRPHQVELLVQRGSAYLKAGEGRMAIEDFEIALTHNDKLVKAYSGRAAVLTSQERYEYALIWLTKALHRFESPRQLAEILFARGKAFFQMGRMAPAVVDFTAVIELMRSDPKTLAAARYARALANCQAQRWDNARKDFKKILKVTPDDSEIKKALAWLEDRESTDCPSFLKDTKPFHRPTRPPVVKEQVEHLESAGKWKVDSPFDSWIVRTADRQEYGPVQDGILETWISEGRVAVGMKLLRADWSKWKRAEKLFPELSIGSDSDSVKEFPGIVEVDEKAATQKGS